MASLNTKYLIAAAPLPAGLILLPLVRSAGNDTNNMASAVAGWMILLLLVQGTSAIMAGCLCKTFRGWCMAAMISGAATVTGPITGCGMGLISTGILLHAIAVFFAWAIFGAGLGKLLSRFGLALAAASGMIITLGMTLSPLVLTPIFLILQQHHWHWPAAVLLNCSPSIWIIDALATDLQYNWFIWFHAPMMYQHVVLDQNTLMPALWDWWIPCLAATGIGAIIAIPAHKPSRGEAPEI